MYIHIYIYTLFSHVEGILYTECVYAILYVYIHIYIFIYLFIYYLVRVQVNVYTCIDVCIYTRTHLGILIYLKWYYGSYIISGTHSASRGILGSLGTRVYLPRTRMDPTKDTTSPPHGVVSTTLADQKPWHPSSHTSIKPSTLVPESPTVLDRL